MKQKRCFITLLITGFIVVEYGGISRFLHYKRHKGLQKAFVAMENKVDLQQNRVFHLEDSMVMCGINNKHALEILIDTVHKMHNQIPQMKNYLLVGFIFIISGIYLNMEYAIMQ